MYIYMYIHQDTPLHTACRKGKTIQVDAVLQQSRAGIDVPNGQGATGLAIAAEHGHHQVVQLLLKSGARKDSVSAMGWTPLCLAARHGHADVVEELLDWRVDIEASVLENEFKGWTPLHCAAHNGHLPIVALLVKARANRNAMTSKGQSASELALSNTHPAVAQYLASKGTNIAAEAVRRLGPQRLPATQLPGLR